MPAAGFVLAACGFVYLLLALSWHEPRAVVSALIYGVALVASFLSSTLYHASRNARTRRILQALDHSAIYLLIAGSVTPFALMPLWDHGGYLLLILAWAAAACGIIARLFVLGRLHRLSSLSYLVLGWIGVAWLYPLSAALDAATLVLLLGGGVAYTAGLVFFHWRKVPFANAVWHAFVIAGAVAHFLSIAPQVASA